jgi:hypothetical protein
MEQYTGILQSLLNTNMEINDNLGHLTNLTRLQADSLRRQE